MNRALLHCFHPDHNSDVQQDPKMIVYDVYRLLLLSALDCFLLMHRWRDRLSCLIVTRGLLRLYIDRWGNERNTDIRG